MTHLISVGSTKKARAQRFGHALERAMKARDVGTRPLAEALSASRTTIMYWCSSSCQRVGRKRLAGRDTRQSAIRAERALGRHRAAVEAFCRACEPAGWCQAPECELRPVSPLPLVAERLDIIPVVTSKRNGWTGRPMSASGGRWLPATGSAPWIRRRERRGSSGGLVPA